MIRTPRRMIWSLTNRIPRPKPRKTDILKKFPVVLIPHPQVSELVDHDGTVDTYLYDTLERMFSRLHREEKRDLRTWLLNERELSLATMCAGSESPALVWRTLLRIFVEKLDLEETDFHFLRTLSAEWAEHKRDFSLDMLGDAAPDYAFGDVIVALINPAQLDLPSALPLYCWGVVITMLPHGDSDIKLNSVPT